MQDLPVILKCDNLQTLDKALGLFIDSKFCKNDFYFLNRRKNVRWPLITVSITIRIVLQQIEYTTCTAEKQQCGYVSREDSDQPSHQFSLVRAFAVRRKKD